MEILIPGLVLVGFMVWASTRIKRNAARAFEREEIETSEFSMLKPEGFLALANPPDGLLFSAYSKEFGSDDAEKIRRALIEVRKFPVSHLEEIIQRTRSTQVVSEEIGVIGERKCANIVIDGNVDGVPTETHLKLVAAPNAVYQLSATVLKDQKDALSPRIDEALSSFAVR